MSRNSPWLPPGVKIRTLLVKTYWQFHKLGPNLYILVITSRILIEESHIPQIFHFQKTQSWIQRVVFVSQLHFILTWRRAILQEKTNPSQTIGSYSTSSHISNLAEIFPTLHLSHKTSNLYPGSSMHMGEHGTTRQWSTRHFTEVYLRRDRIALHLHSWLWSHKYNLRT
jgi:hypothetical protein